METGVRVGTFVDYTVDLFTGIGSVIVMHQDEDVLERDVRRIRQLESENLLFEYETGKVVFSSPSNIHDTGSVTVASANRPDLY